MKVSPETVLWLIGGLLFCVAALVGAEIWARFQDYRADRRAGRR